MINLLHNVYILMSSHEEKYTSSGLTFIEDVNWNKIIETGVVSAAAILVESMIRHFKKIRINFSEMVSSLLIIFWCFSYLQSLSKFWTSQNIQIFFFKFAIKHLTIFTFVSVKRFIKSFYHKYTVQFFEKMIAYEQDNFY